MQPSQTRSVQWREACACRQKPATADRCGGSTDEHIQGHWPALCFPVQLHREKPGASTNRLIVSPAYNVTMSRIDDLTERVERLLLRHEELQRTHALLQQQLVAAVNERDSLRTRLAAARARIDVLIDKLPPPADLTPDAPPAE